MLVYNVFDNLEDYASMLMGDFEACSDLFGHL